MSAIALAGSLGLSACAVDPNTKWMFQDAQIAATIQTALVSDRDTGLLRIIATTDHGVVLLSGTVGAQAQEQRAIELARAVQGVKEVKSTIKVGS